jgi:hypothetical protein
VSTPGEARDETGGSPGQFGDLALQRVYNVLNRYVPVPALEELRNGLDPARRPALGADTAFALGFDTNAAYRLGIGARGADALDYLRAKHRGPVVVPGQTVQEIWNNLLSAVEPKAKRLRKKFEELESEIQAADQTLGASGELVREAIDELVRTHGDWIDPASQAAFDDTLDVFSKVGVASQVPRSDFARLAEIRKATKTPPGFHDSVGYGDFFVWADFLYGVSSADESTYSAVVFVTNDVKPDWSRNGVAHPVLVAEARAVRDVPFRLWTLDEFRAFAKSFSS